MSTKQTDENQARKLKPLPYFPFWSGDMHKLSSDMGALEHGAFLFLVQYYWDHDRLPPAEKDLVQAARVGSIKAWRSMSDKILDRLCQITPDLDDQKEKARGTSKARSDAANKRWVAAA